MKVAYRIQVKGIVQGVGFRYNAIREAETNNITGFVKNEFDGSVTLLAEGEENDVKNFIAWCNEGPAYARVSEVNLNKTDVVGYNSFEVKR